MSTRKGRARAIGIWKIPNHLSKATFEKKFDAFTDAIVALPIGQKHFVKFELMFQNDRLDEHLQALGLPAPEQTVVCIVEGDNWDTLMTLANDEGIRKGVADALADLSLQIGPNVFAVDVVTKIEK